MRKFIIAATALTLIGSVSVSEAQAGCVTGAIVGGIAGHFAHHGLAGAAAGCAAGHYASKYRRNHRVYRRAYCRGRAPPSRDQPRRGRIPLSRRPAGP